MRVSKRNSAQQGTGSNSLQHRYTKGGTKEKSAQQILRCETKGTHESQSSAFMHTYNRSERVRREAQQRSDADYSHVYMDGSVEGDVHGCVNGSVPWADGRENPTGSHVFKNSARRAELEHRHERKDCSKTKPSESGWRRWRSERGRLNNSCHCSCQ